jgi:uncharacterized protein (UPF0332 family)
MNLENKSDENLIVAMECVERRNLNAAANRAYYAVFQKVKHCITQDKEYYGQLLLKHKKDRKIFKHGIIQTKIVAYLESKKDIEGFDAEQFEAEKGKDVFADIDFLYKERIKADYMDNSCVNDTTASRAQHIINLIDKYNVKGEAKNENVK